MRQEALAILLACVLAPCALAGTQTEPDAAFARDRLRREAPPAAPPSEPPTRPRFRLLPPPK